MSDNNKLRHKLSKTFVSAYADGASISVMGNGNLSINFYMEVRGIKADTLTPVEGLNNEFTQSIAEEDVEIFREDAMRLVCSLSTARAIADLLNKQCEKMESINKEREDARAELANQ